MLPFTEVYSPFCALILTYLKLKAIKHTKVRKFYEHQNEALNDWLEVDSVVRSIADDIFESFDPDRDHDGLLEHGGALQAQGEDIEAFLPEEERESRRKAERSARRAINVRQTNLITAFPAHMHRLTTFTDQRSRQHPPLGREDYCLLLLFIPVAHCLHRRLSPRPPLHHHRMDHQPPCSMAPRFTQASLPRRPSSS